MSNQERFNSAVMGWISEATEAIEGCGAVSDSAKRCVDEMRCQCGDAYQSLFHQQSAEAHFALTEAERNAIQWCLSLPMTRHDFVRMQPLRLLLDRMPPEVK